MSEVDRLSNSGLYPALPIADRRGRKEGSADQPFADKQPGEKRPAVPAAKPAEAPDPNQPRPPKSLIDEYA
jgi:hypothetical protein